MSSISSIIIPLYQKYANAISKQKGIIDLSIKDPSLSVKCPQTSSNLIAEFIKYAINNTKKPHLVISSTDKFLIIKEENTLLDADFKSRLTEATDIKVSSRIGFGTKLQFPLR